MTDLLHILTSGQSLSIGGSGYPGLSTASEADNAFWVASNGTLGALEITTANPQRPELSMGYRLAGARPLQDLAFTTFGAGGQSIAALSPGGSSGRYESAITRVENAHSVAAGAAKTYEVEGIHWIQGEEDSKQDTPPDEYISAVAALRSSYIADIASVTGQDTPDLPFIMSQTASWAYASNGGEPRIGLAQLEAARTLDGVYLVGGQYQLPYIDPQHLTNVGYYYLGELHARAHQAILDGAGWAPFAPIGYTVTPTHIDVQYAVPVGPLVFDTTTIAAQPGMGFSLHGTPASITAATIIASDTVRLALSQPPTGTDVRVGYGVHSYLGGAGVGNLRDSETATSVYDGSTLANWAAHSRDRVVFDQPASWDIAAMYLTGADGGFYELQPGAL